MLVSDWPASAGSCDGSTEGGASAWANQLPEMDLSQEPPPPDWFYWDVREEDFIRKLSQITLCVCVCVLRDGRQERVCVGALCGGGSALLFDC